MSSAGLAFRRAAPIDDLVGFVSRLFDEEATQIPRPVAGKDFDIRRHSDIRITADDDVHFVFNSDLVRDYLRDPDRDITLLHQRLDKPEFIMLFCRFDSGDEYGYAFIKNGKRTRTRLYSCSEVLVDAGEPEEFESAWLNAEFYFEEDEGPAEEWPKIYFKGNRETIVGEWGITSKLLAEAMMKYFSIPIWDIGGRSPGHFFRLPRPMANLLSSPVPGPLAASRPWWKLW